MRVCVIYTHTHIHTHTYIPFVPTSPRCDRVLLAGAGDQFVSGAFGRGSKPTAGEVAASPQLVSVSLWGIQASGGIQPEPPYPELNRVN